MKRLLFVAAFLFACQGAPRYVSAPGITEESFAADEAMPPSPPVFRLPRTVAPIRYHATLTLLPEEDTFEGEISIELNIQEKTSLVWLNASQLKVKTAQLKTGKQRTKSPVISYETPSKDGAIQSAKIIEGGEDFVGLSFPKELSPGEATLHLSYQGSISRQDESGIFKQEEDGRWYLFTQFEATDARRAFPCFDEPSYKVPWRLTIRAPKDHEIFSNTPAEKEKKALNPKNPLKELREVTFAETRPLPSYLVAFAVGPFEVVEVGKVGQNNVPARVITPKGRREWGKYAAQMTPELVKRIEDYMGIPYPYEKLDQIAVPSFPGAMENAGLITYSQGIILGEPGKDTINRQRGFVEIAAHEIAHQWFGDLVTMAWWDDLWLNESFAEWMMHRVMLDFKPEWSIAEGIVQESNGAKGSDSVLTAPKIRHSIETKADISDAFNGGITYAKGQAVLFMFERALGPEVFQKGVRRYLKENAWKNATISDLLRSMSAEAGRDVTSEFNSFIDQPGVPLVSVSLSCDKKSAPKVSLSQKRYLPLGISSKEAQQWKIPMCVRYSVGGVTQKECFVLEKTSEERALSGGKPTTACPDWLLLNSEAAGYYYAGYSKELLQKLLKDGGAWLSVSERLGVLSDLGALVDNGTLQAGEAMALIPPMLKDNNRHITSGTAGFLTGYSQRHLISKELKPNLNRMIQKLYGEKLKGLSFSFQEGASEEERLSQRTLVGLAVYYGEDKALIEEAKKLAQAWLKERSAVHPEFVGLVLDVAARYGDMALFEAFYAEAKKTEDRRDRNRLLDAIGGFRDPSISRVSFPLVLSGDFELREAMSILWGALDDEQLGPLAYEFVTRNFDAILSKLPSDGAFRYGAYLPYFGSTFCDKTRREEVSAFFSEKIKKFEGGEQALKETLEGIDLCVAFRDAQKESVANFLKAY